MNAENIIKMSIHIETIYNPETVMISFHMTEGDKMSVSNAVRMALKRAGKHNGDLAELWGYKLNAVSNKFQMERWTGKELSEVASLTGSQLAFVYPDGTQITIPQEDPKKEAKAAAKQERTKAQAKLAKAAEKRAPAKPKQKKTPAKKAPEVMEEQISFFD